MRLLTISAVVIFIFAPLAGAAGFPLRHATDTKGKPVELPPAGATAVGLVFLNPECPICQRYAPTLAKLAGDPKTPIFGVIANGTVTRTEAAKFAADFLPTVPVLFDGAGAFATWLTPTHVPEAFVLTLDGQVMYRGRIDDWYAAPGKPKGTITEHNFRDALASVAAGKVPAIAKTKPVGCLFEDLPDNDKPTFHRHIAPILYSQCATCHRPGEVAPFSLLNYDDAKKRAKQIAIVTTDRTMPPWKAEPNYGHFRDERRLTDAEIKLIAVWAAAGAPEGDPADKLLAPTFTPGWHLGRPDLIIRMPEPFTVPADGPDPLQNFVIPIDVPTDQMVGAIEFRPGNRRVVHHAICYLDHNGAARKLDAAEPGPGYSAAKKGLGFFPTGSLAGWAPGTVPRFLPDGMGRFLKKGSDAVLQIHYHPTGKVETDQSELGLYFVKKPATKYLGGISLENWEINIPPGEKNYHRTASYTLPTETIVVGAAPHMHQIGMEMKAWAELPDGKVVPLIHIKRWNFDWQDYYVYREPFALPKGTVLKMEAWFDNSAENVANPNKPPKRVTWGEGTTDEMAMCILEVTCEKVEDLLGLIWDDVKHRKLLERFALGR